MTKTAIQEVEVEYTDFPESGVIITDSEGTSLLPCDKTDIQDWILDNGEEGTDFIWDKQWQDNYPDKGYYEPVKILIEDAWGDQLRDFAFAHKSEWVDRTEH